MSSIFLSYSRKSEAIVKILVEDIRALGHTVWFDQDLKGGQAWWDQILATTRNCDVFIFLLHPMSLNSAACKLEYGYANALGKPILPILVAEGVSTALLPPALSEIQFVDYRKQDRDAALRLARAIAIVPPAKPLPDPLPSPPNVPISYLSRLADQIEMALALSSEQQSALVFDLKQSLRDSEVANDAYGLLSRLRKRRDLLATIAEDIDELLVVEKLPKVAEQHKNSDVPAQPAKVLPETQRTGRPSVQQDMTGASRTAATRGNSEGRRLVSRSFYSALVSLVVALIAGFFVFGGIASASAGIAQVLFVIFLVLVIASLVRLATRLRARSP